MAYKDILLYVDPTPEAVDRMRFAVGLAKAHGARLVAVDATGSLDAQTADRVEALRTMFEETTRAAAVEGLYVPGEAVEEGEYFSHCVDLIVAPPPSGPARDLVRRGVLDRALTESGAPMLILPPEWKVGPVGQSVVIAWNGGREALRATHDAMPILERAKKVTIFAFSSRPSALRASAERLRGHLKAHGVAAEISDWTNTGDISAVEALFASLDTQDADLIVAGAFGHSRLFEGLFGGVSLDLIRQQTLPVLMSH